MTIKLSDLIQLQIVSAKDINERPTFMFQKQRLLGDVITLIEDY